MSDEFEALFDRIRPMFAAHADAAVPKCDKPGAYYLDTHEVRAKDGYRTVFGGVEIKKNYVSAHLFPVYTDPRLLEGISEPLRKRMQGKSCFNFKKMDEPLLAELNRLIDTGAELYKEQGRLSQPR
jgi:hypothetical protein